MVHRLVCLTEAVVAVKCPAAAAAAAELEHTTCCLEAAAVTTAHSLKAAFSGITACAT